MFARCLADVNAFWSAHRLVRVVARRASSDGRFIPSTRSVSGCRRQAPDTAAGCGRQLLLLVLLRPTCDDAAGIDDELHGRKLGDAVVTTWFHAVA